MGGAFSSVADDGTSFYWNPAGLGLLKGTQFSGMYAPQFGSIKNPMGSYHHVGMAQSLTGGAVIAVNWIRFAIDDIPVFSELSGSYWDRLNNINLRPTGEPEGFISDTEDAFIFSFAKMNRWEADLGWEYHRARLEIPIGINIKWIRQKLGEGEASGIGVDLGFQFRLYLDRFFSIENLGIFSLAMFFQDLTKTTLSWNTKHKDTIPYHYRWGVSYQFPLPLNKHHLCIAYDHQANYDRSDHLGLEYTGFDVLMLRAGSVKYLHTGQQHISTGIGLQFWIFNVDYAFENHKLDDLHRISCSITF